MLTWTLLLIVLPVSFYGMHVFGQLSDVRKDNLRTLSKAADQTAQNLDNLVVNVRSLADKCGFVDEFVRRQPRLALLDKSGCTAAGDRTAQLRVSESGIEIWSTQTPAVDQNQAYLKFGVRLGDLLAEIPFGDVLDLLLIADGSGKVIAQHRPYGRTDIGLKVTSLEGLPLVDDGAKLIAADLQRSSATRTVQVAGAEYELLCQPLNVTSVTDGGPAPDPTAAAKQTEQTKGQPAPGSAAPQPRRWLMCGLVASQGEFRQSLQVAPFLAVFLFAAIVFAFLSWPLLKLLLMSERDRLQFADLCFLLIGTWAAAMLATILVLSTGVDRQLRARSARSLENLAARVEGNLQAEVDELKGTLVRMDGKLAELLQQQHVSSTRLKDISDLLAPDSKMGTANEADGTARDKDLDRLHSEIVSAWWSKGLAASDVAFWANCTDAKQFLKATVKKSNTPRVSLRERDYFNAVLQDRLWASPARPSDPATATASSFVQPLRSITTGEFATVVSVKSQVPAADNQACTNVAAIQARLVATTRPVLSPGVGFAIIDEDGKAVLHSDARRALFENLFEEMDDGQRLHAIVQARKEAAFTTTYLGRPHQVHVRPLAELPWFVVTFADTETTTTRTVEIIGHAFILCIVYLTIFALVAGLYWTAKGPEIPRWLWPNAHRPEWSAGISAAALAAFVLAAWFADGDKLLVIAMLIPLAVVGTLYFLYCRRGARNDLPIGSSQTDQVRASIAAAYALWMIIAIVPAALFFMAAADSQDRLQMRDEAEYLTQRLAHRSCALEDDYRDVNLGGICNDCKYPPDRLMSTRDLYPSTMFEPDSDDLAHVDLPRWSPDRFDAKAGRVKVSVDKTALVGGDAPTMRAEDFWSRLEWLKPIYNQTTVRTRYLDREPMNEERVEGAEWFHSRRGTTEIYGASALACGTQVTIASRPPPMVGEQFFWWTVPLGAALAAALFLWVRYGARRIFFGEIRDPLSPELGGLTSILDSTPPHSSCWIVATVTSPHDRVALLAAPRDASGGGSFARIDASAYRSEPPERKKLLDALEGLAASGDNVLIVSAADPYTLLSLAELRDLATTASGAAKPDPDHSRWCQLLTRARFVTVSIARPRTSRASTAFWRRGLDEIVTQTWLNDELASVPDQPESRSRLLHHLVGSTQRQALDRIVDYAAAYYLGLWDACSEAEKLVLVQLAFENVVNPKQSVVIRRLLERGLLLRDPALRLFNRSFALFITRVHDPAEVSEWEHRTTGFSWAQTRWVLFGFLLIASLFLWVTQRELFNTSVLFLSAAAAGLPAVLKLMSDVTKSDKKG